MTYPRIPREVLFMSDIFLSGAAARSSNRERKDRGRTYRKKVGERLRDILRGKVYVRLVYFQYREAETYNTNPAVFPPGESSPASQKFLCITF